MTETTEHQAEPTRPVLWLKDLQERWQVSDVTLWRLRRDRKIPAPTITLGKRVGWSTKTIEDFEAGRRQPDPGEQDARPAQSARKRVTERREAVQ